MLAENLRTRCKRDEGGYHNAFCVPADAYAGFGGNRCALRRKFINPPYQGSYINYTHGLKAMHVILVPFVSQKHIY